MYIHKHIHTHTAYLGEYCGFLKQVSQLSKSHEFFGFLVHRKSYVYTILQSNAMALHLKKVYTLI